MPVTSHSTVTFRYWATLYAASADGIAPFIQPLTVPSDIPVALTKSALFF